MVALALRIHAEQDALPEEAEPVLIGGQLWLTTITAGRCTTELLHQFDDYATTTAQYHASQRETP